MLATITNSMITLKEYEDMPEYWDYQRKIAFNKEKCMKACENIVERFEDVAEEKDAESMFELMWHQIEAEDYEEPPIDWIPKDPALRIQGESYTA
jgi:hypothetical protein